MKLSLRQNGYETAWFTSDNRDLVCRDKVADVSVGMTGREEYCHVGLVLQWH